jgi:hypothetical protein
LVLASLLPKGSRCDTPRPRSCARTQSSLQGKAQARPQRRRRDTGHQPARDPMTNGEFLVDMIQFACIFVLAMIAIAFYSD